MKVGLNFQSNFFFDKKSVTVFLSIFASISPLIPQWMKFGLVLFLILINLDSKIKISKNKFLFIITFSYLILSSIIFDIVANGFEALLEPLSYYFYSCFILGVIFSSKDSLRNICLIYHRIIFVISFISLVFFLLAMLKPSVIYLFPEYQYYHTVHRTIYIHNFLLADGELVLRNSGIASEPGIFQLVVSIGLISYLKFCDEKSIYKIVIYLATLITTFSTASVLSLLVITFYLCRSSPKMIFVLIVLLLSSSGLVLNYFTYHIEYKLLGSLAFEARLKPITDSFNILTENILGLGNTGVANNNGKIQQLSWESFGQIAVRYGAPLICWFTLLFFSMLRRSLSLTLLIIIGLLTQLVWFTPILTILYFSIISEDNSN